MKGNFVCKEVAERGVMMDRQAGQRGTGRESPWRGGFWALWFWLGAGCGEAMAQTPAAFAQEAPRVQALLEQGWAAQSGRGLRRSPALAATLYQEAGRLGSPEGYYRAAMIYMPGRAHSIPNAALCRLIIASQLGHRQAMVMLEKRREQLSRQVVRCPDDGREPALLAAFDLDAYMVGLPAPKQRIFGLIHRLAPRYQVDPHLALAIAAVESNFNNQALSPKNAMGVMQLIPATAERFGVSKPFDPEQNIRGGLAYLRWLGQYFKGDLVRIIAAYNAGEGAVERYNGIPPYPETMAYVERVLAFSGRSTASARTETGRKTRPVPKALVQNTVPVAQ